MNQADIQELVVTCGFQESGYVAINGLQYQTEVRSICEGNVCRHYGTSWACPPAVGTLEDCKARVDRYAQMLLFSGKYDLEDSYDFEGMVAGWQDFKNKVDGLHQKLNGILPEFLLLSNEGCGRCTECTYPNEPCRFPHLLHHSLEGYGFMVNQLAAEAGIRYHNGPNTVTYFGALLF